MSRLFLFTNEVDTKFEKVYNRENEIRGETLSTEYKHNNVKGCRFEMFKGYPTYIIVLFVMVLGLFIYRLGMSELTLTELLLYTAIVLFVVFSKKDE